ncbi:MAG: ATP-dependent Clp protease proteolytic subunit [Verrucomicrobiae bacterium]
MKSLLALVVLCAFLFSATIHAEEPSATAKPAAPITFPELKKEQEQLSLENSIADLRLKKELSALSEEKQRRDLESSVAQQRLQAEIAALQAQLLKLTSQGDLAAKQVAIKAAERKSKLEEELAIQRDMLERTKLANDLAAADLVAKQRALQLKDQEVSVRAKELQNQRAEFDIQVAKLNTELDLREKRDQWKNRVDREIAYTKEPFQDGVLTISDRRIALNGPIGMDTAANIQERIDYFNNQSSEFPIFIVIDSSPGGSVMAGYKILKAMAGSPAPVYVVVKSFAASMAAGITSLAKKSFAYPNAIILHHQILRGSFGNLTQQKEGVKELEEWWARLASPIAAKMGVSLEEFIKKMYQNSSSGDWKEFGDGARKLKWVDQIVETIREESLVKNPDADSKVAKNQREEYLLGPPEADGIRHIILPRLDPVDCYYLYNPDGYYRIAR